MTKEIKIPRRFIRIWLGEKPIPEKFEKWWKEFKDIHPEYDFVTIRDETTLPMPKGIKDIYWRFSSYSGQSNALRVLALYELGGVYLDTDMMPLKRFDELLYDERPFCGMRSSKSFATGVIGSPPKHFAVKELIDKMPDWFYKNEHRSTQAGPDFVSWCWFGKDYIRHIPKEIFYLYDGFKAPKREIRDALFDRDKSEFPEVMLAAHYGNHVWGGKPKRK